MEDEKDSQSVYCGKCNNRYSKRQNFYEHFKKKSVGSQDKNFPGYIDVRWGGSSLENAFAQRSDNARAKVNFRFSKAGYSKFEQIYSHGAGSTNIHLSTVDLYFFNLLW